MTPRADLKYRIWRHLQSRDAGYRRILFASEAATRFRCQMETAARALEQLVSDDLIEYAGWRRDTGERVYSQPVLHWKTNQYRRGSFGSRRQSSRSRIGLRRIDV